MTLDDFTGIIPGNLSDSIVVTVDATGMDDGTYHAWVLLTDNFGHEIIVQVNMTVDQFLGNEEATMPGDLAGVSVYPNPASGNATINVILNEPSKVTVSIANTQGQQLPTLFSESAGKKHQLVWDGKSDAGNALPDGLYIIKAFSENESGYARIILVR